MIEITDVGGDYEVTNGVKTVFVGLTLSENFTGWKVYDDDSDTSRPFVDKDDAIEYAVKLVSE